MQTEVAKTLVIWLYKKVSKEFPFFCLFFCPWISFVWSCKNQALGFQGFFSSAHITLFKVLVMKLNYLLMILFPVEKKRKRRNEATAGGRKAKTREGLGKCCPWKRIVLVNRVNDYNESWWTWCNQTLEKEEILTHTTGNPSLMATVMHCGNNPSPLKLVSWAELIYIHSLLQGNKVSLITGVWPLR